MDLTRILDSVPPGDLPLTAWSGSSHGFTPRDMVVPVAMTPLQQELTQQVVSLHYSAILQYINGSSKGNNDDIDLTTLRHDARQVATHPYLMSGLTAAGQKPAEWSQSVLRTSGKFLAMFDMISSMGSSGRLWRVAVVACEPTLGLLADALRGKCRLDGPAGTRERPTGVKSKREDDTDYSVALYLVTVAESDSEDNISARLASQGSFDFTVVIEGYTRPISGLPTPVLHLITYNSIEHVTFQAQGYAPLAAVSDETPSARQNRVYNEVGGTVVLRDIAGQLPPNLDTMVMITDWINRGGMGELQWPEGTSMDLDASQYASPRLVEVSLMDSKPSKFRKISNGADNTIKTAPALALAALSAEVDHYRRRFTLVQATIDELRADLHETITHRAATELDLNKTQTKLERSESDRTRLRNRLAEIEKELFALSSQSSTDTDGCGEKCSATKLLAQAKESLGIRSQENEYMRAEYQRASQRATDQAAEIKSLQAQNSILQTNAQGEISRLRQLTFDEERDTLRAQVHGLESRNFLLEEQVRRLLSRKGNSLRHDRGSRQSARSASVK